MKTKIFLILIILSCNICKSQSFQWALQEHYSAQSRSESVGTDKFGNVYITGRFLPDYNNFYGSTTGCVFSKYTSSGNLVWTDTVLNVVNVRSVVDSIGNMYATGYFGTTATFGSNIFNANGYGGFLVKYNPNGICIWAKNIWGSGIALHPKGGLFTTDSNNGILSRFDNLGNMVWTSIVFVKNPGGLGVCKANSVSTDKYGNAYITGRFKDTVSFGTNSNSITLIYNGPYNNNYTAKYDSSGNFMWIKPVNLISYGFDSQLPFYINTDSSGNSFIGGTFAGNLTLGTTTHSTGNNLSIIIAKYNSNGILLWDKTIIGTSHNEIFNVVNNNVGNIFITGALSGSTNFGNNVTFSSGQYELLASIIKFDANGKAMWLSHANSTCCTSLGYGVATDNNSNVYMVGQTSGSNTAFGSTTLTTIQYPDMFLTQIKDLQGITGLNMSSGINMKEDSFIIYPNPTIGNINIIAQNPLSEKAQIKISNVMGQLLYIRNFNTSSTELKESIDLSQYPKGIYFVQINTGSASEVRKIVLE